MRRFAPIALALASLACARPRVDAVAPVHLVGTWEDDYGIRYTISDTLWFQRPGLRYQVRRWDLDGQLVVAQNGMENPADGGLFSRIDWVLLEGMPPWEWAFCMAIWKAPSADEAGQAPASDRGNPRSGCGGHPFSRMRRLPADSASLPVGRSRP